MLRLSLALACSAIALSGCRSAAPVYAADTLTPETVVDGRATEWPRALRPVPSEAGLSLGLRRNANRLVVVVIAGDERQARRIALGGLRVWVDPTGGRDRTLGIAFPAPERLGNRMVDLADRSRGEIDDGLRRRYRDGIDAVEITRGDAEPVRQAIGSVDGLETAATWTDRGLIVEMGIDLDAVGVPIVGDAVGLGVELVDVQRAPPRPPARRLPNGGADEGLPGSADRQERLPATIDTVTRWLRAE